MIEELNRRIFLFINDFAGKSFLFDWFAFIGAEYLPFVFIVLLIYLWFSNKENSRNNALYATYASLLGLLINFFISLFCLHPRPFMDNIGITLIHHVPETSFPSDHTTFMLSISITLLFLKETKNIGIIFTLLGLLGGGLRVLCGVHYPFDICGSLIVSITSGVIIISIKKQLIKINKILIRYIFHILKSFNYYLNIF